MKKLFVAIISSLLLCSFARADSFVLGTIFELSGADQATAQEAMNGALLAVKKINQSRQENLLKLEMQSTSGTPENIISTIETLKKKPKISAITGIITDDAALTAAPALQANNLPFLCTGAQVDGLAQSVGDNIFTLAIPDIRIGQLLAEFSTNTIQTDHIAVIRSDLNDSCARQADSYIRRFKQNGGQIMAEMNVDAPDADLSFIVEKIKSLAPAPQTNRTAAEEGVEVSSFGDSGSSIITEKRPETPEQPQLETIVIFAPPEIATKAMNLLQSNGLIYRIIGGTGFDRVPMHKTVSKWPATVFYAAQASLTREDMLVQDFIKDYSDFFGSAPRSGYSALGFDAVMLLSDTVDKNGASADAIRLGLSSIENFTGVSGRISFQNRAAHKRLYIEQVQSGTASLVAEMD